MQPTMNYDHSSQTDAIRYVKENLARHNHMALATVDPQGNPWVVCVALSYDDKLNIIWKSAKDTLHSRNITAHPEVSVCVYSKTDDFGDFGLYITARAHEVTDEIELKRLIDIRFTQKGKPTPGISEFNGDSSARLYYAELTGMWVNDDSHEKVQINIGEL